MSDGDKDLLEDEQDSDEENTEDSGSDNSAPPDDEAPSKEDSKRINDLMGKWQKEEAARKKAEAELAALRSRAPAGNDAGDGNSSESAEFIQFARDQARMSLFNSDPALAEAGLTVDDITGSTIEEMRKSLSRHKKLIGGFEARLRAKVLREHGLDPEVVNSPGDKALNFDSMSDKDFDAFIASRKTGRET